MKYRSSVFYCTRCGNQVMGLPRVGNQREAGHLKKLWCLNCMDDVNCAEIRENDPKYTKEIFDIEFKYGNFSSTGDRKEKSFKKFIAEVIKNG